MSSGARWKVHGLFVLFTVALCLFVANRLAVGKPQERELFLVGGVTAAVLYAFVSSVLLAVGRSSSFLFVHLIPLLLASVVLARTVNWRRPPPPPPVAVEPEPVVTPPPPRAAPARGWERSTRLASFRARAEGTSIVATVVAHFSGPLRITARHQQLFDARYGEETCQMQAELPVDCVIPLRKPMSVTAPAFELGTSEPGTGGQVIVVTVNEAGEGTPTR